MSRRSPSPQLDGEASPAARLEQHLRAKACIPYEENLPDREFPHITCSIYGVPKTNELFVQLSNGKQSFIAVTSSPVAAPAMADRIFGIDVADAQIAFRLADKLWAKHRAELLHK